MTTILCALELSPVSGKLTAIAASVARRFGARLELLHVVQLPPELPPDVLEEKVLADYRAAAETSVATRAAAVRGPDLDVVPTVRLGFVEEEIARRAEEIHAELVIVGTHARHGVARMFLGSVAERTIRGAPCPTLVIPPEATGRLAAGELGEGPLRVAAGIDASAASETALAWLRGVGERTRLDLRLVHLYSPGREHERLGLGPPVAFEVDPEVEHVLGRELRASIARAFGRDDLPLRIRPSWGGEDDPLAWEAETDDADLLVVGTSQRRASRAIATVRGSRVPVVCVPKRPRPPAARALTPIRSVLVTTDFSPLGDAAVREGYRLLARGGGEVILAHVAEPERPGLDPEKREELEVRLLALVPESAPRQGIRSRAFVTTDASPSEAILKAVRRFGPDVVVMSSHGRSGLGRALHGSVAERVLRHSPRPVLIVPAESERPVN